MRTPTLKNGFNFTVPNAQSSSADIDNFYVKVTADGGANSCFGPYTLRVGCSNSSGELTVAYDSNLVTSKTYYIADSLRDVYTFISPTANRAWCTPIANLLNMTSGGAWHQAGYDPLLQLSQNNLLVGTGTQPHTSYNLTQM
jgi:hypothetical protein